MVPALRDVLPRSGITADAGNIGYYGGLLFALFLVGWGMSLVWGPVADRFGRVRTLSLTILCLFGIHLRWRLGDQCLAARAVSLSGWNRHRRRVDAQRYVHRRGVAGRPPPDGRGLHADGLLLRHHCRSRPECHSGRRLWLACDVRHRRPPAFLVLFIQKGVHEPKRWKPIAQQGKAAGDDLLAEVFQADHSERALSIGFDHRPVGRSVYVPSSVTFLATAAGHAPASAARMASYATVLLSFSTVLGCLALPPSRRTMGPPHDAWILFRPDVPFDRRSASAMCTT